jgi:hypothetical protein
LVAVVADPGILGLDQDLLRRGVLEAAEHHILRFSHQAQQPHKEPNPDNRVLMDLVIQELDSNRVLLQTLDMAEEVAPAEREDLTMAVLEEQILLQVP